MTFVQQKSLGPAKLRGRGISYSQKMDNLGDAEDEHLMGSYSSDVAVFYEIITQVADL